MTVLEKSNWEWIKQTAERNKVSGSLIINQLIERQSSKPMDMEFEAELRHAGVQTKLRRLNDKKLMIEAEEQRLLKEVKGGSKQDKTTVKV